MHVPSPATFTSLILAAVLLLHSVTSKVTFAFDLQTSPSFIERSGQSILAAEHRLWNVTAQTLEQILRTVDLTPIERLDSANSLLMSLSHPDGGDTSPTRLTGPTQGIPSSNTSSLQSLAGPFAFSSTWLSSLKTGDTSTSAVSSSSRSAALTASTLHAVGVSPLPSAGLTAPLHKPLRSRVRNLSARRNSAHELSGEDANKRSLDLSFLAGFHLGGNIGTEAVTSETDGIVQVNASSNTDVQAGSSDDAENIPDSSSNTTQTLANVTSMGTGLIAPVLNLTIGALDGVPGGISNSGGSVSDGSASERARRSPGDLEWYIELPIGSPSQAIALLPDTGSSDLLIFSSSCSGLSAENHTLYEATSSTSYANTSFSWQGGYADGTGGIAWVSSESTTGSGGGGHIELDQAGSTDASVDITHLLFALVEQVIGGSFDASTPVGVLGLGQDALCTFGPICTQRNQTSRGITLFSRLVKSGVLAQPVLSIKMVKGVAVTGADAADLVDALVPTVGGGSDAGYFAFGEIRKRDIAGGLAGLTWVPVTSRYYWGSSFDDVRMGSISVSAWTSHTNNRFIIDTGTTLIFTTYELAFYIHSLIPGSHLDGDSGIFYIPCTSAFPVSPNVFFVIGGRRLGVPISDLAWRKSGERASSNQCISGIQGGGPGFTVLGDMFIKNHLLILSYGNEKEQGLHIGLGDRPDVLPIL